MELWTLLLTLCCAASGLRIEGFWESSYGPVVLAKFGFQKTDPLNLEHTRGYIYGNVTAEGPSSTLLGPHARVLLVLASKTYFPQLHAGGPCASSMATISNVAFDHSCLTSGSQDFFRWVPCPVGSVCPDEDDAEALLPGSQLTYRTQDKFAAGYWYLILLPCTLNQSCHWTSSAGSIRLRYDLWLVNGSPLARFKNPFEHQFSFDEQDVAEIHLIAFFLFSCLSFLATRAVLLVAKAPPKRLRALRFICWFKTAGIAWNLLHVFIFAFNGRGFLLARLLGDVMSTVGSELVILIIILLARGWSMRTRVIRSPRGVLGFWGLLTHLHVLFFILNSQAVDTIEEVDIFKTGPGYAILGIRITATLWFFLELRKSVQSEEKEERVSFLVHFGAGFLVWFLYLPLLGLLASQISILWRFKIILCTLRGIMLST